MFVFQVLTHQHGAFYTSYTVVYTQQGRLLVFMQGTPSAGSIERALGGDAVQLKPSIMITDDMLEQFKLEQADLKPFIG